MNAYCYVDNALPPPPEINQIIHPCSEQSENKNTVVIIKPPYTFKRPYNKIQYR